MGRLEVFMGVNRLFTLLTRHSRIEFLEEIGYIRWFKELVEETKDREGGRGGGGGRCSHPRRPVQFTETRRCRKRRVAHPLVAHRLVARRLVAHPLAA